MRERTTPMTKTEADLRAALIEVLSDVLDGLVGPPTNVPEPRSAPKPPEVISAPIEAFAEPEWGGLPVQEFPPIGSASQQPVCPVHHSSHLVPAGISKSTGKKYGAFWGCDERDCTAGKNGKSWRADYKAAA
jgi:hypothetical protein